jgi:hypothetical protein
MDKKISTRTGIITALLIMAFILFLKAAHVTDNSPVILLQFAILFLGLLSSCYFLYKYYADIKFLDAFKHCIKTLATIIVLVAIGNAILFLVFKTDETPWSNLTILIGSTIFKFSLSGILSSLFSSFIFNTFTKK